MSNLKLCPLSITEANKIVKDWHRHNKPTQGGLFAIGAEFDGEIIAAAIVGRPIARKLQDGFTAEVLRVCCTPNAPKNTNSFLYGACWRAWRAMGGRRLVTYTLQSEGGASLRAAGWRVVGEVQPSNGWLSRPREYQPVYGQKKFRWEAP